MHITRPDIAASVPPIIAPSPIAASPAPRRERAGSRPAGRLRPWLGRLTEIGEFLVGRIRRIARREENSGQPSQLDATRGWDLVARALCWTHALKARLAARVAVNPEEVLLEAESPRLPSAGQALSDDWLERAIRRALRRRRAKAADEIAGLTTAEVVLRVCADLAEAATALDCAAVKERVVQITASARAVLDALGDAVTTVPARPPADPDAPRGLWARALAELERMKAMAGMAPVAATAPGTG